MLLNHCHTASSHTVYTPRSPTPHTSPAQHKTLQDDREAEERGEDTRTPYPPLPEGEKVAQEEVPSTLADCVTITMHYIFYHYTINHYALSMCGELIVIARARRGGGGKSGSREAADEAGAGSRARRGHAHITHADMQVHVQAPSAAASQMHLQIAILGGVSRQSKYVHARTATPRTPRCRRF